MLEDAFSLRGEAMGWGGQVRGKPKEVEQFDSRVVLQGGGDSSRLLGEHTVTARSLRRHYGLLYEVDTPTELQKFKCYEVASLAALLRPVAVRSVESIHPVR